MGQTDTQYSAYGSAGVAVLNGKGVYIHYGDVAPEAKENFIPNASQKEFDTLHQLQQYNLIFPNYVNPCELYSCVLDGVTVFICS